MRKGKDTPTVIQDPHNPANWVCTICGVSFPIKPLTKTDGTIDYKAYARDMNILLGHINSIQFWAVKMGGDKEDTKLFLDLKNKLPRYMKVQRNVLKQVNKRQAWEERKANTDSLSQFDSYAGFNYRS
jgi:hypothetical protein